MYAVILSIAIPVAVAFAAWAYELASDYTKDLAALRIPYRQRRTPEHRTGNDYLG
jgi:hypothetical protein